MVCSPPLIQRVVVSSEARRPLQSAASVHADNLVCVLPWSAGEGDARALTPKVASVGGAAPTKGACASVFVLGGESLRDGVAGIAW